MLVRLPGIRSDQGFRMQRRIERETTFKLVRAGCVLVVLKHLIILPTPSTSSTWCSSPRPARAT